MLVDIIRTDVLCWYDTKRTTTTTLACLEVALARTVIPPPSSQMPLAVASAIMSASIWIRAGLTCLWPYTAKIHSCGQTHRRKEGRASVIRQSSLLGTKRRNGYEPIESTANRLENAIPARTNQPYCHRLWVSCVPLGHYTQYIMSKKNAARLSKQFQSVLPLSRKYTRL